MLIGPGSGYGAASVDGEGEGDLCFGGLGCGMSCWYRGCMRCRTPGLTCSSEAAYGSVYSLGDGSGDGVRDIVTDRLIVAALAAQHLTPLDDGTT